MICFVYLLNLTVDFNRNKRESQTFFDGNISEKIHVGIHGDEVHIHYTIRSSNKKGIYQKSLFGQF